MSAQEYFDYETVARDAGVSQEQLHAIERLFESDYPSDRMLRELHVLRACNAVKAGRATVAEILSAAPASAHPPASAA